MQNKVSGKPDAGEWAERIRLSSMLVRDLVDYQRETLLWAAREVDKRGVGSGRYLLNMVVHELERLAESCGRGK